MTVVGRQHAEVRPVPPSWWADSGGRAFVGRSEELRTIDGAWRSAAAGRRQVVLVLGEAGAGKTRLVAEASTRLAADGAAVLVGCCMPDAPLPYEPFRAPLSRLLEGLGTDEATAEAATVRDLLALPGGKAGVPTQGSDHALQAFDALVAVLRRASARQPLILVVEDLHWATRSTLHLLGWIVRRTTDAHLLVVITARNTPPDLTDALEGALSELYRQPGVAELALSGLGAAEIARLVADDVGIEPARALELADPLLAQTAGNPFLLHEICRDLGRRGGADAAGSGVRVPDSVRELYGPRVRQFPDAERRVLELSAVLGDRFATSALDAVTGSAPETMATVDRALDLGLLVALPDEEGFGFPHALARQSVVDLAPRARLAEWHGRVADVLEARSGRTLPEVLALAHHTQHALGRVDKARRYLVEAAELAEGTWAYPEAAQHYRSAAALCDTASERHQLLLRAAQALRMAGLNYAAQRLAAEVVTEAVDAETRLTAATLAESYATLLGGDPQALQMLIESLEQYPADLQDPRFLRGLAGLCRGMGQVLDSADTDRLYDAVLAEAKRSGDIGLVAEVLHGGLPRVFGRPGRTHQTLKAAWELSALVRTGDPQKLESSAFFRCLLGLRSGNMDDVRAGVVDYRVAHDLDGHWWSGYWPEAVEFDLRFMRGDFAGATELAPWLRDWMTRNVYEHCDIGHFGLHMFPIHREMGRLDGARHLVTGAESIEGVWAPGLLALYTALRMAQPTRRVLDLLAGEAVLDRNHRTEYMPTILAYLVEAALFLEDAATLTRLRPRVAEHEGLNLVSDQFICLHGAADRYLGMIDAALGDDPLPRFDAAEALASGAGFDVDLALTLTARARHLAQELGPEAPEVRDAVERARAIAEPIGQRRVLDALPGPPPGAGFRPGADSGLTDRELDVLRLVCEGATNRDIARALVISENTAANHVRSILMKTGSPNRTRAAILAVSKGWVPEP
jgi:DNA-binding CsgD family transcriptional regulator/tetratricopeptide (TPR) repeat protein